MNTVQEIAPPDGDINGHGSDITHFAPLGEWSIIVILLSFLVKQIWLSFAKKMAVDTQMLEGLVTHLEQTNEELIDCLKTSKEKE